MKFDMKSINIMPLPSYGGHGGHPGRHIILIIAFENSASLMLLVCDSLCQLLPEYVDL